MINESEGGATGAGGQSAAAIGMAMNEAARDASVAAEARAFLREQTELSRLQKATLDEEARLNISHLHFRRFGDFTKAVFEIAGGLLALFVIFGLGAMIWNASRSSGLVVEAFSVPASVAERGLTGEVVASRLLDRIAAMQAETQSQRASETYANYWGNDFKVEIPETGISLGELERYLREKLGHPTHITGEVVQTEGGLVLTARAVGEGSASVRGTDGQSDVLVQQLAERVYRLTQPYRYGVWLSERGRLADAQKTFAAIAVGSPPSERAWGYLGVSNTIYETEGQLARLATLQRAAFLAPDMFLPRQNIAATEDELSRPEQAVRDAEMATRLGGAPGHGGSRAEAIPQQIAWMAAQSAANRGDYSRALAEYAGLEAKRVADSPQQFEDFVRALAAAHDLVPARAAMRDDRWHRGVFFGTGTTAVRRTATAMLIDAQAQDWPAVLSDFRALAPVLEGRPGLRTISDVRAVPLLAEAEARLGRFADADTAIAGTPSDCYVCLIVRGTIRSLEHKPAAAEWWLARAASSQPSIPFAYLAWGQARLERGDPDGAIEKFAEANRKGPHFADPLEMWGEALVAKNRSDLALAKFEEANNYAPNWGRLHLKWGKALYYAGRKDEAQKQFQIASHLDLSAADSAALARARANLP